MEIKSTFIGIAGTKKVTSKNFIPWIATLPFLEVDGRPLKLSWEYRFSGAPRSMADGMVASRIDVGANSFYKIFSKTEQLLAVIQIIYPSISVETIRMLCKIDYLYHQHPGVFDLEEMADRTVRNVAECMDEVVGRHKSRRPVQPTPMPSMSHSIKRSRPSSYDQFIDPYDYRQQLERQAMCLKRYYELVNNLQAKIRHLQAENNQLKFNQVQVLLESY